MSAPTIAEPRQCRRLEFPNNYYTDTILFKYARKLRLYISLANRPTKHNFIKLLRKQIVVNASSIIVIL